MSRYLAFKITDMIGFTFAPHWFVKMSFETHKIKKLILDLKRRKMCNLFKKGAKVHFLKGRFFGAWVHFKNFNDLLNDFHLCVFFFVQVFSIPLGGMCVRQPFAIGGLYTHFFSHQNFFG